MQVLNIVYRMSFFELDFWTVKEVDVAALNSSYDVILFFIVPGVNT